VQRGIERRPLKASYPTIYHSAIAKDNSGTKGKCVRSRGATLGRALGIFRRGWVSGPGTLKKKEKKKKTAARITRWPWARAIPRRKVVSASCWWRDRCRDYMPIARGSYRDPRGAVRESLFPGSAGFRGTRATSPIFDAGTCSDAKICGTYHT
jgi:hypothetical protein